MSRFLEYGVFVPNPNGNQGSASSSATLPGQWARVGGTWCKVGPDGKPLPPRTTLTQTSPLAISQGERGVEVDGGRGSAAEPFSQATGAADGGSSSGSGAWKGRKQQDGKVSTLTKEDIYGEDDDGPAESGDDDSSPTIAVTQSSGSSAAGSAAPRAMASSRRRSFSNSGGSGWEGENDDVAGAGGGGSGASANSGGFTVAVDDAAGTGNRPKTAATDAEEARPATRQSALLTPGLSRSYSTDKIVAKFFGEDALAAVQPGSGGSWSGSSEFESGLGTTAACIGERAPADDKGSKTAKHGRSGSGSSNAANSPVNVDQEDCERTPVETRDVACQWDGSEMGDDENDEDEFVEVKLPDTPDCRALTAVLRLYDHARLENKRLGVMSSRPGWGVEENIESWDGVYLDTEDRVVALDVDGDPDNRQAMLIGPLPVEISGMDHLEQLTMRRHRFKGRIPAEFGQLTRLTHLNLSNCRLIGFIPPSFGDLVNLVVLNLSWNFLSGDLPTELSKLHELEELMVNSNAFSGPIPPEFGKLRKLQRFNAGHNIGLSGTLPPEMCRMAALTVLDLRHNKISGKIPNLFGRLTNLQQLWLQDNQLTDDIPAELARLPRLQMLHLANNKLSGVIPMALRGHPRYLSFKILPGNFALGERVAPNDKEIEAASRRRPSTSAMQHSSTALARSQQQQQQQRQRRDSSSLSPSSAASAGHSGSPVIVDRRLSGGNPRPGVPEVTADESKKGGFGRNSLTRKVRGMKRIKGKKSAPPTSPTGSTGTASSGGGGRSPSGPPKLGGVGPYSAILGHASAGGSGELVHSNGKSFLEVVEADNEGGGDESPDGTATLSTGTGASEYASPLSHEGSNGRGGGVGGGDGGGLGLTS